MKKFEIINDRWIKNVEKKDEQLTMKISAVSQLANRKLDVDSRIGSFTIYISGDGVSLHFYYSESEEDQYKSDLIFLEKLLF